MARYVDFEETFRSPGHQNTEGDALYVLSQIREGHPESSGWEELDAYVEQLPDGKWRAVRKHRHWRNA